jgi:hypothetical protein
MIALGCASHLLVDLPLFGGPVLFVLGAVLLIRRSERRQAAGEDRGGAEPRTGSPQTTKVGVFGS